MNKETIEKAFEAYEAIRKTDETRHRGDREIQLRMYDSIMHALRRIVFLLTIIACYSFFTFFELPLRDLFSFIEGLI